MLPKDIISSTTDMLIKHSEEYTVSKLIEELQRELIIYHTKKTVMDGVGFSPSRVARETADVLIRLHALLTHFNIFSEMHTAYKEKAEALVKYRDSGLYKEF